MPYHINKSDLNKPSITVPDMPPGVNTVDTSLKLIGRNYPNFGQALAEDFVHLLENFASASPPNNPIEGQLWYATSVDRTASTLYVFNDTTWTPTNGVHHSLVQPGANSVPPVSVALGDIWVDTANLQLWIYNGSDWTLVGPGFGSTTRTGAYPQSIVDTNGNNHSVILMYLNDIVMEIIAGEAFTPRITIEGFTNLVPGINLSTRTFDSATPRINGIANAALSLRRTSPTTEDVSANNFVRNDIDQRIDGSLIVNNNAGLQIGLIDSTFVIKKGSQAEGGDATFINLKPDGNFNFQVDHNQSLKTILAINGNSKTLELGSTGFKTDINVSGNAYVRGGLFLAQNTSSVTLEVAGLTALGGANITGYLQVTSATTVRGLLTLGVPNNTVQTAALVPSTSTYYDIGSPSAYFGRVYATQIGISTASTQLYGTLSGSVDRLTRQRNFSITGTMVTTVTRPFDGTQDIQLNTIATNRLILDQIPTTFATQQMNPVDMMVFSSGTNTSNAVLKKISRRDFLAELYDNRPNIYTGNPDTVYNDIIPVGTIFLWPNNVPPANFLKCDGSNYTQADPRYTRLHDKIGTTYGYQTAYNVDFNVPNLPPVLTNSVPKTYVKVSPFLSTTGTGATFDVSIIEGKYQISLSSVGTSYTATTLCQIAGTQVGGATPINDIAITVLSTATNGAISGYSYVGNPALNGAVQLTYIIKL